MKEVAMYKPLKKFLESRGYTVHSEVEDVDVMAQKGDELLLIEMKTSFTLQLIYQLTERLKIADQVYAYIPLGKGGRWPKTYKRMVAVLKRLHCGLITLDAKKRNLVTIEFDPAPFKGRTNYRKKKSAIKEFEGRSIDLNEGGSTRELLFTAYKGNAIRIAMYLFECGPSSTKDIKEKLNIDKTVDILNKNYMRWFERVSRGVYQITSEFEFFRLKYNEKINQLWR